MPDIKPKPEALIERFQEFESHLLIKGDSTGIGWLGVNMAWQPLAKSKGGKQKRGNAWGNIVYTRFFDGVALSRERAIEEILKPRALKTAHRSMLNRVHCVLCRKEGDFESDDQKTLFNWQSIYVSIARAVIYFCPACVAKLVSKEKRTWQGN